MITLSFFLFSAWTTEVVATHFRGEIFGPPLALDSYGAPYVLVHLGSRLVLFYKSSGNWIADTLESNASVERDIAIDKFDRIWCIYYTYNPADSCRYLIVASKDSSGWRKDTIEISHGYDFFSNSITTDALGRPHITYDYGQYGFYAYLTDSTWFKEMIDPTATYNYLYCAIDLDALNRPHISYYQFDGDIWYAKKKLSRWYCEVIESPPLVNDWYPSSIRVGQSDVGIAYTNPDPLSRRLKFAYNEGTGWQIDTLTSGGGYVGTQKSVDIDTLGRYWVLGRGVGGVACKDTDGWKIYSLPPLSPPLIQSWPGSIRIDDNNIIHMTRVATDYYVTYDEVQYIYGTPEGIEENKAGNIKTEGLNLEIYPNPFSKLTYISFEKVKSEMAKGKNYELKIYDASGRLVRNLPIYRFTDASIHQISWDGADDSGNYVPSGVYFVVLKDKKIQPVRVVKIR